MEYVYIVFEWTGNILAAFASAESATAYVRKYADKKNKFPDWYADEIWGYYDDIWWERMPLES